MTKTARPSRLLPIGLNALLTGTMLMDRAMQLITSAQIAVEMVSWMGQSLAWTDLLLLEQVTCQQEFPKSQTSQELALTSQERTIPAESFKKSVTMVV